MDNQNTPLNQPQVSPPMPLNGYSGAPKNPKTKLYVILSIVGTLIVVSVVLLQVYILLFYVSPTEYKNAYTNVNIAYNSLDKLEQSANDYYNGVLNLKSVDTLNKNKTAYLSAKSEYLKSFKDIQNNKAFERDKQLNSQYNTYTIKHDNLISFYDTSYDSVKVLNSVVSTCYNSDLLVDVPKASNYTESFNKFFGTCIDNLGELSKSKNSYLAGFGKDTLVKLNQVKKLVGIMQEAVDKKDQSLFDATYKDFEKASKSMPTLNDIKSDFSKARYTNSPLNNLQDILNILKQHI